MQITLTTDIKSALVEEARRQGTTPELLALNCLKKRFIQPEIPEAPEEGQETLADFLADHIGILASGEHMPGGARLADKSGEKFTAGLIEKRQQGRL